ncbi:hypothetical protein J4Q44_G00132460 [Coregonus suidteri]|uniref:Uncharacterized protein n=1 Tax=Coregonus suidteri TaxID=861788 RepID=A0AAN8LUB8_9TELE
MTCHVPSAVRSSQTRAPLLQPQLLQELPGGHLEAGRDQGLPRLQKHVSWGPAPCQPSPEEDACHSFCSVKKAATQREQLRTPLTALLDKIAVVDKTKPSWEKMASQIGAQAQKTEGGRAEEE